MIEALAARGRRAIPTIVVAALASGVTLSVTTLSPALAQEARALGAVVNAVVNCRSVNPCGGGVNSGTGFGVMAASASSNGVDAGTRNPSLTTNAHRAGVLGHDDSTDGGTLNYGVSGISPNGFGVQGTSTNGSGLAANSTNGIGIQATSFNNMSIAAYAPSTAGNGVGLSAFGGNYGVLASSDSGSGVQGYSTYGTGVVGNSPNDIGVTGESTSGVGIHGTSQTSVGVEGYSYNTSPSPNSIGVVAGATNGYALFAQVGLGSKYPPIFAQGGTADSSGNAIYATDVNYSRIFDVDNAGNVTISGQLYTQGFCHSGCSRTRGIASYAARESTPSIEDVGEGQLVAGTARVHLDPAFANVIDDGTPYAVFVSPEGTSHGLYVTHKSRSGFTVAENLGGHSTISFSYRIVAKPYGVPAARLPMIDESGPARPKLRPAPRTPGAPRHALKLPLSSIGRFH